MKVYALFKLTSYELFFFIILTSNENILYLCIMRKCSKCKIELIEKNAAYYQYLCNYCRCEVNKQWAINNPEKRKKSASDYHSSKKDEINEKRRNAYMASKEDINKKKRDKKKNNYLYKLSENIRSLIVTSMKKKGYKKSTKTEKILGIDYIGFKCYIEKQFKNGMNWENQGHWHFDHIKPIKLAKSEEDVILLNHYTNFQPMWAVDNLRKGSKYVTAPPTGSGNLGIVS